MNEKTLDSQTQSSIPASGACPLDVDALRAEFSALGQLVNGKPLVYLDSGATSQKPQSVVDAINSFYLEDCANVHRAAHTLSARATVRYEEARAKVARFFGADEKEVIFVRGTTEGINLVAQSWGRSELKPGDEILISEMEHHSNIVPWQIVAEQTGAVVKAVAVLDDGQLDLESFESLLNPRTKMVALIHISNVLGTVLPVREIIKKAHAVGAKVLLDGAQAVPHMRVDWKALDCDFYTFSAHKAFGPTGIGVLYGRRELLEAMPPWQGGGDMIDNVTIAKTTWNDLPYKFEAGTPNIAGVFGLGAAIDFIERVGPENIAAAEEDLLAYADKRLCEIPGLRMIGQAPGKASVCSFVIDDIHAHDLATIIDKEGVAIRAGHHCAQPLMERFGVSATARASFAFYNTKDEIDVLINAINKCRRLFGLS
ncbi:MAG: cysteine desulfurase [Planctomycetota bacterium]